MGIYAHFGHLRPVAEVYAKEGGRAHPPLFIARGERCSPWCLSPNRQQTVDYHRIQRKLLAPFAIDKRWAKGVRDGSPDGPAQNTEKGESGENRDGGAQRS